MIHGLSVKWDIALIMDTTPRVISANEHFRSSLGKGKSAIGWSLNSTGYDLKHMFAEVDRVSSGHDSGGVHE